MTMDQTAEAANHPGNLWHCRESIPQAGNGPIGLNEKQNSSFGGRISHAP
jgi:hypothetical protein